jgi:hypothetical protein
MHDVQHQGRILFPAAVTKEYGHVTRRFKENFLEAIGRVHGRGDHAIRTSVTGIR